METISYEVPAMYGDHHVQEVRRIILELPGVEDVYASSAFHMVEVLYDPEKVTNQDIENKLSEYGYLGELPIPVEAEVAAYLADDVPSYFRHTEVFETAQNEVGFVQNISFSGRPLWNCPGMGVIKTTMED